MGKKRILRVFFALMLCALPGGLAAQTIETTPVPVQPKPDFSSMRFLVGTWSCSTKSSRRPAPYISTSTYKLSSDGWWLDETTITKPVAWVNRTTTIYDKFTYDADTKRWIDLTYGDMGTYGLTTSNGWQGDNMTWHDANFAPGADIKASSDFVMTKASASKMTTATTFKEASGRTINVTGTCSKAG
jgi:hypothetical protein